MAAPRQEEEDTYGIQGHTPLTNNRDNSRDCVICLNPLTTVAEIDPCGHNQFHIKCATKWLMPNPRCPLCRVRAVRLRHGPRPASPAKEETRVITELPLPGHEFLHQWPRLQEPPQAETLWAATPTGAMRMPSSSSSLPRPAEMQLCPVRVLYRRHIYRNGLYSLHVDASSTSGYRDLTPALFKTEYNALANRAATFLGREMRIFVPLFVPPPGFRLEALSLKRIIPHTFWKLKRYFDTAHLRTARYVAGEIEPPALLAEYSGASAAAQLMHELHEFLRSPPCMSLDEWDDCVKYVVKNRRLQPGPWGRAAPCRPEQQQQQQQQDKEEEKKEPRSRNSVKKMTRYWPETNNIYKWLDGVEQLEEGDS